MIRAILLDFDFTSLVADQIHLSDRNMAALRAALDRGVDIIPSTGRCEDMFPPQIEAEPRIRYWITSNGGRVVDRKTGEVLYSSLFTPDGDGGTLPSVRRPRHILRDRGRGKDLHGARCS